MATAIESLRAHLTRPRRPVEIAVDCLLFGLFLVGVAYLMAKTYQVFGGAAYDFKYIWLAGEAWKRGINPYAADYFVLGKQLIAEGHVPDLWVYPPNWIVPAVLIALADVDLASFIFNIVNIVMVVASSALLTAAFPPLRFENAPQSVMFDMLRRHLHSRWHVFFLHVSAVAVLQATALTLAVGQTSILFYFGISLLLYGLAKNRQLAGVLGLAIVFLKPQIAVIICVALVTSKAHRALVAQSVAVSAAISLPAFIVAPTTALDFLVNLAGYDGITTANWPHSTTGIRHVVWTLSGLDPGNVVSMVAALLVMAALYLMLSRARPDSSPVGPVTLACAVAAALAPLHVYDLLLVGPMLFTLAPARPLYMAIGSLGAALLWRAGDLAKLTGFYEHGTLHFEGTRLATLGAVLMLIAVFDTVRRRRA